MQRGATRSDWRSQKPSAEYGATGEDAARATAAGRSDYERSARATEALTPVDAVTFGEPTTSHASEGSGEAFRLREGANLTYRMESRCGA